MAAAAPAETLTVTGVPITVVPLRIVKVSVPSLTVPAALVTVALRGTFCAPPLKVAEAEAAAVALAAALTTRDCDLSVYPTKLVVPLYTALMMYVPPGVPAGRT